MEATPTLPALTTWLTIPAKLLINYKKDPKNELSTSGSIFIAMSKCSRGRLSSSKAKIAQNSTMNKMNNMTRNKKKQRKKKDQRKRRRARKKYRENRNFRTRVGLLSANEPMINPSCYPILFTITHMDSSISTASTNIIPYFRFSSNVS